MTHEKFSNVFIRTVKYLNDKDAALVGMFLGAANKEIPIYYEYCQKKNSTQTLPSNDIVGYATNFHIDGDAMVGDVYINPSHPASFNFTNTLDNYGVGINNINNELVFELSRFSIYNKEFKEQRDKAVLESTLEENNDLQS